MIELIIYGLVFFAIIPIAILAVTWSSVKLAIQKMWYIKKGFGLVGIVGDNFIEKFHWRKFEKRVKVGKNSYSILRHFIIKQFGIPTIHFYEGDSNPIDMLKRNRDKLIDPELYDITLIKERASGSISQTKGNNMMFYLTLGACIGSLLAVALVFNMSGQMTTISQQVAHLISVG